MAFPHDGKKFVEGVSGNPNGRPKTLVKKVNENLKEQGYEPVSNIDVVEAYRVLLNLPLSMVAAIAKKAIFYRDEQGNVVYLQEGDEYPIFYRIIAKELISGKGADYLEKALDRAYGKAKSVVQLDQKINSGGLDLSKLNTEELEWWRHLWQKASIDEGDV